MATALVALLTGAAIVGATDTVDYLNGIRYVWPTVQGTADDLLTITASSSVAVITAWSPPPTAEGLWSGAIVFSTVACPAGWTRLGTGDNRLLRGSDTHGATGGNNTHTHTLANVTGGTAVTMSGSTSSSTVSISGSTAVANISHGHGQATQTTSVGGFPPTTAGIASVTIYNTDPSHSHGVGSLAGGSHSHGVGTLAGVSHGHGVGTLAVANDSTVAAYYQVYVCQKD